MIILSKGLFFAIILIITSIMKFHGNILKLKIIVLLSFFSFSVTLADNHNIYETLEQIQKDLKTLEKAVYSGSIELNNSSNIYNYE